MRTHADTFTDLLAPALDSLRGIAMSWLRNETDVEDVMQETSIRLFMSADRFAPELGSPRAWVATVLRNECYRLLKKRGRRSLGEVSVEHGALEALARSESWEAEAAIDTERELELLAEGIEQLPERWRDATKRVLAGQSHAEVAAAQGVAKGAVDSGAWRARRLLREHMQAA